MFGYHKEVRNRWKLQKLRFSAVQLALAQGISPWREPAGACGDLRDPGGQLRGPGGKLRATCEELRATCEELRATCEELREPAVVCSKVLPPLGNPFSSLGKLSNTLFTPFSSRMEVVLRS
ncbi:hypothetical protein QL285_002146 [Trifolium repens]|nr:hypothetical protein QL285_002146 [Trifolium repens]